MDHYSYLIYSPYDLLSLGVVLLLVAVTSICVGKVLAAYYGVVNRAEDPTAFWANVAIYILVGVFFIADFLNKVH